MIPFYVSILHRHLKLTRLAELDNFNYKAAPLLKGYFLWL